MKYYLYNIDRGGFIGIYSSRFVLIPEFNTFLAVPFYIIGFKKNIFLYTITRISQSLDYCSLDNFYRSHVCVPIDSNIDSNIDELDWLNLGWPEIFEEAIFGDE